MLVTADSAAFDHVCPLNFPGKFVCEQSSSILRADGRLLISQGVREVYGKLASGRLVKFQFVMLPIQKPILSIGRLISQGFGCWLGEASFLQYQGARESLIRQGTMFYLPVRFQGTQHPVHQLRFKRRSIYFVEWCCSLNSKLSNWFQKHGHQFLRIGLPVLDASRPSVINGVVNKIYVASQAGLQPVVWVSLPCTVWST